MINLNSLADVVFVEADKNKVETMVIGEYESITGRSLAKGDPVRLFLLCIANIIILLLNTINETGKQNLLRYAKGTNLDHKGLEMGVERKAATAASTTMEITLSTPRGTSVTLPSGTRFTAGDGVFFALPSILIIPAGAIKGSAQAICLDKGAVGNGYIPGQIKILVDPVPYVASVVNITTSEGGSDVQSDDSYREDIQIAPEKFSVAGPTGAYEYHAKHASSDIVDVYVWSPAPGEVEIRPLLEGGTIPGQEALAIVLNAVDDRSVRPLTDKVKVLAPEQVSYNLSLTYFIDKNDSTQANAVTAAVTEAVNSYILWQKTKLGRDINPSELISRVMQAGAKRVVVSAPTFTELARTQVAKEGTVSISLGGLEDA